MGAMCGSFDVLFLLPVASSSTAQSYNLPVLLVKSDFYIRSVILTTFVRIKKKESHGVNVNTPIVLDRKSPFLHRIFFFRFMVFSHWASHTLAFTDVVSK